MPLKVILVLQLLPIIYGVEEDASLGDHCWILVVNILRNHQYGIHVVLNAVMFQIFENTLPRESIACNIMLCFVVAGENSADVPGRDFRLEGTNYFATSFLMQNGIVTLLMFSKYDFDFVNIIC